jgi:hypothetical protein
MIGQRARSERDRLGGPQFFLTPTPSPEHQYEGTCCCGGTVWQGHTAMRISVSSWATTDADVERSLAAILRAAAS